MLTGEHTDRQSEGERLSITCVFNFLEHEIQTDYGTLCPPYVRLLLFVAYQEIRKWDYHR